MNGDQTVQLQVVSSNAQLLNKYLNIARTYYAEACLSQSVEAMEKAMALRLREFYIVDLDMEPDGLAAAKTAFKTMQRWYEKGGCYFASISNSADTLKKAQEAGIPTQPTHDFEEILEEMLERTLQTRTYITLHPWMYQN